MLRQSGTFRDNEQVAERVMDSDDLERERGITILAKNTSLRWKGVKVNIVDTPGHSDFGGEVERTLMMADGALLLVDAAEGPLPQTRFVLRKCLERGFPVIVVINKIDRQDARPHEVLSEVFDLFCDLEASDAQTDFPGHLRHRQAGLAKRELADEATDLVPLFETILEKVPPAPGDPDAPLQIIICNLDPRRLRRPARGRSHRAAAPSRKARTSSSSASKGTHRGIDQGALHLRGPEAHGRASRRRRARTSPSPGIDEIDIGDTIATAEQPGRAARASSSKSRRSRCKIGVNTSPFAGTSKASKFLTSRQLRERLENEAKKNLAIKLEMTDSPDTFTVYGRGELQLAILVETMRREGYEMVSSPTPRSSPKRSTASCMEPVELVVLDVPDSFIGVVTERLGRRRGRMVKMHNPGFGRARLEFRVPARGLIGFRSEFLTSTRGTGLLNTLFDGWEEWGGR